MSRELKDIPELLVTLRDIQKRKKDFVVSSENIKMEDCKIKFKLENETVELNPIKQAHSQIADKMEINGYYYNKMLNEAKDLLSTNVNYWMEKSKTAYLLRAIDNDCRAFLSRRYKPIDNLDVLTAAVQVITNNLNVAAGKTNNANGAKCITWDVSPSNMNICLLNPSIRANLNDLDKGIQGGDYGDIKFGPHNWIKAGDGLPTNKIQNGQPHWVYPSCRISNSETGHGGLNVIPGLTERICFNSAWIGTKLAQKHLGIKLEADIVLSENTIRKENELIFLKMSDMISLVFDPDKFLETCKRFKKLDSIQVETKQVFDAIVKIPGMTEEIRDDIFAMYQPSRLEAPTLMDVQRAVTSAAQLYGSSGFNSKGKQIEKNAEKQFMLEELGGKMIMEEAAVLNR